MTRRRWRVSPSWVLSCVLIAMFATILVVAGFADARGGNDAAGAHPPVGTDSVPPSVRDGGPYVDATHNPVTSTGLPKGTIALTFDDGPDPVWTPQVLAILKKYHIPATFFVVGSNVTRYPDIVRAIHDAGSELGVHTFSHPDLVNVSRWRLDRELAETQLAIAGSAGVTTYMLRPPYSSTAEAIDDLGYATVLAAAQDGYVSVFTTDDSEDWQRPGIPAILHNATPPADATAGSVVLMHDAGGDRSETVAALDQYIPLMQKKGYRFTTVTGGLGPRPRRRRRHPARPDDGKRAARHAVGSHRHRVDAELGAAGGGRPRGAPATADDRGGAAAREAPPQPGLDVGAARRLAGLGDRAGLQRDQEHRGHGPVDPRQRLPARGGGGRRRLVRRHRGPRRVARPGPGPGAPAGQRGQAGGAEPGCPRRQARDRHHDRR